MSEISAGVEPLRLLVVGAGAIGTYLGVSLASVGNQVVFQIRPDSRQVLERQGLHLEDGERVRHLPEPHLAASAEAAVAMGPFDLSILAIKSYQLSTFLEEIQPLGEAFPPILCLQNGVGNEGRIARALQRPSTLAGTVTTAVESGGAGHARVTRGRGVGLEAGQPDLRRLSESLQSAGLVTRLYRDPRAMKWSKLLTNLLGNAGAALLDWEPAALLAHRELFRLEVRQFREALAVMRAGGIPVVDLPGVPVRLLALVAGKFPLMLTQPILARALAGGRGGKMPSLHQDLSRERSGSEVDVLNGAVVEHGDRWGVPTPVNRFYFEALTKLARGTLARESYAHRPERLLAAVRNMAAE